jgi:flagellar FliL protein
MAEDQPVVGEADEDVTAEGGKKKGPNALIGLLKWVAIVLAAIVLIVTVVIITMKIMGGNSSAQAVVPVSAEYTTKREELSWYTSIGVIMTKTSDALPSNVRVDAVLGYKKDDKVTSAEITARNIEIKDFLRRYFTAKTAEELLPRNEEKLRIEIRNSINDDILATSKIRDVKFMTLDVITPQ